MAPRKVLRPGPAPLIRPYAFLASGRGIETDSLRGPVTGSDPTGPGTLLWAETAAAGWRASVNGHELTHARAFNWTNAYVLPARGSVSLARPRGQSLCAHYAQRHFSRNHFA